MISFKFSETLFYIYVFKLVLGRKLFKLIFQYRYFGMYNFKFVFVKRDFKRTKSVIGYFKVLVNAFARKRGSIRSGVASGSLTGV